MYSYNEAVNKGAEQDATLVMIKTKEVEDFILAHHWTSKNLYDVKIYSSLP